MNKLEKFARSPHHLRLQKFGHYFEIYHDYFSRFLDHQPTIVHIGGDSPGVIQVIARYFKQCRIHVVTERPTITYNYGVDGVTTSLGNVSNSDFISRLMASVSPPDIIIDGSNGAANKQLIALRQLYPWLKPGGVYIVEGVTTVTRQYLYGKIVHTPSFLEHSKEFIDQIHQSMPEDLIRQTKHFGFYHSAFVAEKKSHDRPQELITTGSDNHAIEPPSPEEADPVQQLREQLHDLLAQKIQVEGELEEYKQLLNQFQALQETQEINVETEGSESKKRKGLGKLLRLGRKKEDKDDSETDSDKPKKRLSNIFKLGKKKDKEESSKEDSEKPKKRLSGIFKLGKKKDEGEDTDTDKSRGKRLSTFLRLGRKKTDSKNESGDDETEADLDTESRKRFSKLFRIGSKRSVKEGVGEASTSGTGEASTSGTTGEASTSGTGEASTSGATSS